MSKAWMVWMVNGSRETLLSVWDSEEGANRYKDEQDAYFKSSGMVSIKCRVDWFAVYRLEDQGKGGGP